METKDKKTICHDCKKFELPNKDKYICSECENFICLDCQDRHKCNNELWDSLENSKASAIEKLIKQFVQDLLLEIDHQFKEILDENQKLKDETVKLKTSR